MSLSLRMRLSVHDGNVEKCSYELKVPNAVILPTMISRMAMRQIALDAATAARESVAGLIPAFQKDDGNYNGPK